MNNIGPVAVVCVGILMFAYWGGIDPLFVAFGVIGLLGYLAFAGGEAYKKKPTEDKPMTPWYMD